MFEERIAELNRDRETVLSGDCTDVQKTVYTPEEIQNILGISRPTVYKLLKERQFHVLKIGHCLRVSKTDFDNWLQG